MKISQVAAWSQGRTDGQLNLMLQQPQQSPVKCGHWRYMQLSSFLSTAGLARGLRKIDHRMYAPFA